MRQITFSDVQDTFLAFNAAEMANETTNVADGMEISALLVDAEAMERMGLPEEDQIRIMVWLYGAFTAGALTAKRLMEEES